MIRLAALDEVRKYFCGKSFFFLHRSLIRCSACSSGMVALGADGWPVPCPRCDGRGVVAGGAWGVLEISITNVSIPADKMETYMLHGADGFILLGANPDGSFPDLFETRKEAQAECDRMNGEDARRNSEAGK